MVDTMSMRICCLILLSLLLAGCGSSDPAASSGVSVKTDTQCSASWSNGGTTYSLIYQNLKYSNGDAFVTCEVEGGAYSSTSTNYYRANQTGATSGACTLVNDLDTATGGYWIFGLAGSSASATYQDIGSSNNGSVVSLTCAVLP